MGKNPWIDQSHYALSDGCRDMLGHHRDLVTFPPLADFVHRTLEQVRIEREQRDGLIQQRQGNLPARRAVSRQQTR